MNGTGPDAEVARAQRFRRQSLAAVAVEVSAVDLHATPGIALQDIVHVVGAGRRRWVYPDLDARDRSQHR